ncbi:peptidylprolyl isomerase [Pararhodospirillum photometricum]|uniref:Parvulin-like PPIase n=1 Tax=Pararhodospirillum photometricum DSM 122 TaxID=1150469 RepID=H6SNW4_PARPM|nr:peptidylprolyl isomerase [Pararhodospirillum photometricum]CCG07036.1 PpiC-type peptidyl-prolyl cis-trans isomerase [Pararhodospirillum photometricum DSM 122]
MRSFRAHRLALAGALALPMLAGTALAADPDPVVAKVNGKEIHLSAVQERFETMKAGQPQLAALPLQVVYEQLLDSVVGSEIVTAAGREAGLEKDPVVQKRLAELLDRLIGGAYLEKVVDKEVTDAALQKRYDEMKAKFTPEKEVHARHILVDSEDKAKEIIKKLDAKADFAELAKDSADSASGASGGDLGYFTKDRMVKEFADAAFALQPGTYSKAPVKSEFGWHVIKVEDLRDTKFPELNDIKGQIHSELAGEAVDAKVKALKEKAKIDLFGMDGKPLPAQPAQ